MYLEHEYAADVGCGSQTGEEFRHGGPPIVRTNDARRRICDGVEHGIAPREPRLRALPIVDRRADNEARRLTLVIDSPRADQHPKGFAMCGLAPGLEPVDLAVEIILMEESSTVFGIEQCQDVSGIAGRAFWSFTSVR